MITTFAPRLQARAAARASRSWSAHEKSCSLYLLKTVAVMPNSVRRVQENEVTKLCQVNQCLEVLVLEIGISQE